MRRALAVIRSYEDLHRALRLRADQLGVSNDTLDEVCGFADRYCSKLLAPDPRRTLGRMSLPALLGGLAVKLILVHDPEQLRRVQSRLAPRKHNGKHRQPIEPAGGQQQPVR